MINTKENIMRRFEANFIEIKSHTGKDIVEMEIVEHFDEEISGVLCRTTGHTTQYMIDKMGVCINALNETFGLEVDDETKKVESLADSEIAGE